MINKAYTESKKLFECVANIVYHQKSHISITSPNIKLIEEHYDITNGAFVTIWHKAALTLEEAAKYSGVGINKLRDITNDPKCNFVLFIGSKRFIKRKELGEYISKAYSI